MNILRKTFFLALASGLLFVSSCAYKTCPTYAKQDKPHAEAPVLVRK